ncbi:CAP domain-containing protein [Streptomyces sp. NPDC094143]|uniref:CAP domain-containing protein n=1 Tax=Streptomyces sp. NPDC094143 TaxID=3155310 RepID=UPI0033205010
MTAHPYGGPPDAEDGMDEWDDQWDGNGSALRFSGAGARPPQGSTTRRPYAVRTRRQALEDDVARLMNQERVKRELVQLRVEERLRTSSRAHSEDMAAGGFLSHVSSAGTQPADRMLAAGYLFPAAENVAVHEPNAMAVVRAWMDSPGRRRNILNPAFRSIGVGVHLAPESRAAWWTQNFGYV